MEKKEIKEAVKKAYGNIVKKGGACCSCLDSCGPGTSLADDVSKNIGYTEKELEAVPEGANLGLGCGNPVAVSSLQEGDTVLDLGCGAGFDSFIAANKVGEQGKVIGVDMTPAMVEKAKENARKGNYKNVEFRLAEIEKLPVDNSSIDVVISNCVINLVPDKKRVFKEVFRVLKPGARFIISDIVLLHELPDFVKSCVEAYVGCISGAILKDEYIAAIKSAGLDGIRIINEKSFPVEFTDNDPMLNELIERSSVQGKEVKQAIVNSVQSITVSGVKPAVA